MKPINQMSSREAMALPEHYQNGKLEALDKLFLTLRSQSVEGLLKIISSTENSLDERWVAATLLGLMGDPRICPDNPEMVDIPAATISIGATQEQIDRAYAQYSAVGVIKEWLMKEYPRHQVTLPAFRMTKFLITNAEYLLFLKETQHASLPSHWQFGIYNPTQSNHPVYGVKPESADQYAVWLSNKTKRKFRLPTEYEWEYAAAGKQGNEFPWGDHFHSDYANTWEAGIYATTPIGIFPQGASPFGCLDMAGNVEEYVANNYFAYPNGAVIQDDLGGEKAYRVARGGSCTRYADLARCSRRHGFFEKDIYLIGFRLVEEI